MKRGGLQGAAMTFAIACAVVGWPSMSPAQGRRTAPAAAARTSIDTDSPASGPTPEATPTATAPRTPTAVACTGNCDGDSVVTINELIIGVRIATDGGVGRCAAFDANHDGKVMVNELVAAVNNLLFGCGVVPPTARPTATPSQTGTITATPTSSPTDSPTQTATPTGAGTATRSPTRSATPTPPPVATPTSGLAVLIGRWEFSFTLLALRVRHHYELRQIVTIDRVTTLLGTSLDDGVSATAVDAPAASGYQFLLLHLSPAAGYCDGYLFNLADHEHALGIYVRFAPSSSGCTATAISSPSASPKGRA